MKSFYDLFDRLLIFEVNQQPNPNSTWKERVGLWNKVRSSYPSNQLELLSFDSTQSTYTPSIFW